MKKFINQGNNDTRSGFGAGLLEIGRNNKNIVALNILKLFSES